MNKERSLLCWIEPISESRGYRRITAEMSDGSEVTIAHGGKYCESGLVSVCIYGPMKIYPHTIRNFATEEECIQFAEEANNQ